MINKHVGLHQLTELINSSNVHWQNNFDDVNSVYNFSSNSKHFFDFKILHLKNKREKRKGGGGENYEKKRDRFSASMQR